MAFLALQCRRVMSLNRLLKHSPVITQIPDRGATKKSIQFPEYSLLYNFHKIKHAGAYSSLKYKLTFGYVCGGILLTTSRILSPFLLPGIIDSWILIGGNLMIFMHVSGMIANNTIGFIYINDNKDTVKISYLNYWGRRIDIDVPLEDICDYTEDFSRFLEPLYHTIRIKSLDLKLKLYLRDGEILDDELFGRTFGKALS